MNITNALLPKPETQGGFNGKEWENIPKVVVQQFEKSNALINQILNYIEETQLQKKIEDTQRSLLQIQQTQQENFR